jgi:hypothetical protein
MHIAHHRTECIPANLPKNGVTTPDQTLLEAAVAVSKPAAATTVELCSLEPLQQRRCRQGEAYFVVYILGEAAHENAIPPTTFVT